MRWHAAALLLLLLTVTPPAAFDTGVIAGTVVDGDGVPLTGATVFLIIEKGGCPSIVKTTDANGRFAFTRAQPGMYNVRGEKAGYLTQMFREQETGPHSFGRSIILTPSYLHDDIEVVLPRAAAIVSGTVYGEDGNPLPDGGWVFFEDEQHHDMGTTGLPKGRYSVSNLPPGRYYISAVGYSPAANQYVGDRWYYPDTIDKDQAALVTLNETPAYIDIHFGPPRPAAAIFHVQTDRGLPLARAEISLERLRDTDPRTGLPTGYPPWEYIHTLRTAADGVVETRGLRPGDYRAYLGKVPSPFASWRNAAAPPTSVDYYAKSFHLEDAAGPPQIDFIVSPGLELAGHFVMRDGSVPPRGHGVTVDFYSSQYRSYSAPHRIDDLQFAVAGLSPNERYTIREFDANHFKPVVIVGVRLNGRALNGDDIVASLGGTPQTLEVILDRAAVVSGTIAGMKGTRRATAVRVSGDVPAGLYPYPASAEIVDGRFVFRGLPSGEYDISFDGSAGVRRVQVAAGELLELSF